MKNKEKVFQAAGSGSPRVFCECRAQDEGMAGTQIERRVYSLEEQG
jgi:hypothetical protein